MLIGCLGWGSLVWNPGGLPIRGPWFVDGPFLPIEFARVSADNRITLVLVNDRPLVRCLWSALNVGGLDEAREALRKREGIPPRNVNIHIGVWEDGKQVRGNDTRDRIEAWAKLQKFDAVVWTELPPKFPDTNGNAQEGVVPTAEQVVSHLDVLKGAERNNAENYVRLTPRQIDTAYRRHIEARLGWTPYQIT